MIPPLIDPGCRSPGERELFRRLRDDPDTQNWTVLHSLDVARHVRNISGEADFVVIVPEKGVLCVEVKAHAHIRCQDGLWYYGRDVSPETRSPFRQASEAMHSIRGYLTDHRSDLSRVLFWSVVVFTNVPFDVQSEEWHPWQVVDGRAFHSRPIGLLLAGVLDNARAFLSGRPGASWFQPTSREPAPEQCLAIAETLRPHFEMFESPKMQARRRDEEVRQYTEEQYMALDAMQVNSRVVFVGPAGTGKTVLAMEAARRSAAAGRRVLLVCYNRLLGRWLEEQMAPLKPHVVTRTLHGHMLDVASIAPQAGDHSFWAEALPDRAIERLLESPDERHVFDEVVIDEGQDVLKDNYLDFLDLSLRGGLSSGRWRLFGDFERQAIYTVSGLPLEQILETRCGHAPMVYNLWINCRNTPRIAALVHLLGGLEPNYARILRPDDRAEPVLYYYSDEAGQQRLLVQALEDLYADGFRGTDVAVLSTHRDTACVATRLETPPWKERLHPLDTRRDGQIGYCTIHAFKGLEAAAVVVTDIDHVADPAALSLFYVAITRALHRLVILAHESVRQELIARLIYQKT